MTCMQTPMKSQRGVAAVELAIMLPVLITLLTFPVFFGIYFMHYTAAQKAAYSAARYMSTVKKTEIRSSTLAAAASAAAEGIAREMLMDRNVGQNALVEIHCNSWRCAGGNNLPNHVRARVTYRMRDDIFGLVDTGDHGWAITSEVTIRYAGQ